MDAARKPPKRKKVMMYLRPAVHRALRQMAFQEDTSMGAVVERLYALACATVGGKADGKGEETEDPPLSRRLRPLPYPPIGALPTP